MIEKENTILTEDGQPFKTKAPLAAALARMGEADFFDIVESEDGFVGVRKEPLQEAVTMNPTTKPVVPEVFKKYKVHRTNVDPDNKDLPISVTVNSPTNKKVFWPGEEVELKAEMVNVLRDAVTETRLPIPPESGIYNSSNPVALAREYYPTMTVSVDPATGMIDMIQKIPYYIVEPIV